MLSRWEKIKQIRDHILWLEGTAFGERILQDAKRSAQRAWEWKAEAGKKTILDQETSNKRAF